MTMRTVQELLESQKLPDHFKIEPIGFTKDDWMLVAPNGAYVEVAPEEVVVSEDDPDETKIDGYSYQLFDWEGDLYGFGGSSNEDLLQPILDEFIEKNRLYSKEK